MHGLRIPGSSGNTLFQYLPQKGIVVVVVGTHLILTLPLISLSSPASIVPVEVVANKESRGFPIKFTPGDSNVMDRGIIKTHIQGMEVFVTNDVATLADMTHMKSS
jgi:hypothetical protein